MSENERIISKVQEETRPAALAGLTISDDDSIFVWFEKYKYGNILGDSLVGWQAVAVSRTATMEEVNRKIKLALDPEDEYDRLGVFLYSGFFKHLKNICFGMFDLLDICGCCRFTYLLCCCCCGHDGTKNEGNLVPLLDPSIKGNAESVFIKDQMHMQVYIPRFKRGVHDIGVFGDNQESLGAQYLSLTTSSDGLADDERVLGHGCGYGEQGKEEEEEEVLPVPPEEVQSLVVALKGDLNGNYQFLRASNGITTTAAAAAAAAAVGTAATEYVVLRQYADRLFHEEIAAGRMLAADFKVHLSLQELCQLVGQECVDAWLTFFAGTVDDIVIRRCSVSNQFIPFHRDSSLRTMQVALNDCSEYIGGRIVYASHNKLIAPVRNTGTAIIHQNNIIHGVSVLEKGTRYGLFFLQHNRNNGVPGAQHMLTRC
jgi:hypothetical protein